MRAAYLGPAGTNSHDALVAAGGEWEPVSRPTVAAVVASVQDGSADRGLVPMENSREGGVGATLDALVFDAPDVVIVGELVHRVTYCLVAGEPYAPDEIRSVHSHPQATGQCTGFLADRLPGAAVLAAASTADAVRSVAAHEPLAGDAPHAAIGTPAAARLYGAVVLAEAIEDDPENATRFAWIARRDGGGATAGGAAVPSKTTLVFWGVGDVAPGWLVTCLTQLSARGVNLTRIESRPRRVGLGHYMFVCDLVGAAEDEAVAAAIHALRDQCEAVRVLGSFAAADDAPALNAG
jgi:prephenate dehydratase